MRQIACSRIVAWGVVAVCGLAASAQSEQPGVTPLAPPGQPETRAAQPDLAPRITPQLAADAWEDERWEDAANMYRVLAREDPEEGLYAFRLAYALHADGQYRRAVPAHQQAAEFDEYRTVSLYNLGCAHSCLGNIDRAFGALHEAIEAGFDDFELMENDRDLFPLHDDPRWEELLGGEYVPPPVDPDEPDWSDVPHEVEFLLGEWEVVDDRGRRIGSMSIRPEHAGQAIVRRWRGDDGTTGTATLFYDGVLEAWRQVSIDSDGVVTDLAGQVYREEMELEGEVHMPDGDAVLQRVMLEMRRDGDIDMAVRESEDDGRSWRTVWTAAWRRMGVVLPGRPDPWSQPSDPGRPGTGRPGGWKPGLGGPKGV